MKTLMLATLLILVPQFSWSQDKAWSNPSGAGSTDNFRKKAESKKGSRWTLQEWLAQKDKNRMMDLWLAMYKPSPYEFYIQGSADQYDYKTNSSKTNAYRSYSGAMAFYALVMGLEGQYENNTAEGYQDLAGLVNLRIAGNAVQSTHLSLNYGSKRRVLNSPNTTINQQFAGANLEIYVNKSIGLHGEYRGYFPTTDSNFGTITGQRTEAGLFFDIDYIRIYGNWYSDFFNTTTPATTTNERTGVQTGIRFFY
jgi:hypothetical protein